MNPIEIILLMVVLILGAIAIGLSVNLYSGKSKKPSDFKFSEKEAIKKASEEAKRILEESENKALQMELKAQEALRQEREELKQQERDLNNKEREIIQKIKTLDTKSNDVDKKINEIEKQKEELVKKKNELAVKLQEVARLTQHEAEKLLKAEVEKDLQDWMARKISETEESAKAKSTEASKKILIDAMQSIATEFIADTTITTVDLPQESIKSRIIGKNGRNIRSFERLTGVDVLIDETNTVTISCFDPIRREVAILALNRLIKTEKINPSTIEESVEKVKKDILKEIKKTGELVAFETGFNELPSEIIMLLGRFKYRFSNGQSLVEHTIETVKLAEALATELKADIRTAKLAALLHDIGKVIPEEGKHHAQISASIARKYFKSESLIDAIENHHEDTDSKFIESEILKIANAISGTRPGARKQNYDEHIKRIRTLEDIAMRHQGVKEAFVIHSGKEMRVIVKPDQTSDEDVKVMAYKISQEIESSQNFSGVLKVNVIREFRAADEAK